MVQDKGFLELLNAHDLSAFETLYQKYYRTLTLFAYDIIGRQSEAEDVVQDVIVAIWLKEDTFESLKNFEAYLYNAVKFKSINVLKRKNLAKQYADEVISTKDFAEPFSTEELYVELFKAIDKLPKRCREVMLLGVEGKSNAEIAKELQLSIETVKTHRKRALSILRETFKEMPILLMLVHLIDLGQ